MTTARRAARRSAPKDTSHVELNVHEFAGVVQLLSEYRVLSRYLRYYPREVAKALGIKSAHSESERTMRVLRIEAALIGLGKKKVKS